VQSPYELKAHQRWIWYLPLMESPDKIARKFIKNEKRELLSMESLGKLWIKDLG
jgi:hypothetical protein